MDKDTKNEFAEMRKQFALMHDQFAVMNDKFAKIDQRFDVVDQRFDAVDQRFGKMDDRLDKVDQRLAKMDERFDKSDQRFESFVDYCVHNFATKNELEDMEKRIDRRFDEMYGMLDSVMFEVKDSQRSRLLFEGQFVDLDDKVAGHEKRLRKLEKAK